MNINVQYYITGDTPMYGFGKIGSSDNFRQDPQHRWTNNGSPIDDSCRVKPIDYRATPGQLTRLCHVWEYQTDRFGVPIFISSYAGIGTGRFHGFSEYIMPDSVKLVSELGTSSQLIHAASDLNLLDFKTFWNIESQPLPPRDYVLHIEDTHFANEIGVNQVDETWLLTLVSRYWERASIRAFSNGNSVEPVLVCLGEYSENKQEDIDQTIEKAKAFYADVLAPKLPPQVQNITSFSAGVDCRDNYSNLNSALIFCISANLNVDDALQLESPKHLRRYRLCSAEMNFIQDVAEGRMPTFVQETFNKYTALHPDTDIHHITFMADYRVWYALYCVEHLLKEGTPFLSAANLDIEEIEGNKIRIRPARSCFNLLNSLRDALLQHMKKADADELLKEYEQQLFDVMIADMQSKDAKPFLSHSVDLKKLHSRILTTSYEDLAERMIRLITLDQKKSKNPNFIRFYPGIALSDGTDERNALELSSLLKEVIRPLIELERGKEKLENQFIAFLGKAEFVKWACSYPKTKKVFHDFFADTIKDAELHFLLYSITYNYLDYADLACNTLRIFQEQYSTPGTLPPLKSRICAVLNDSMYFNTLPNKDVAQAFSSFCITCFNNYGAEMASLQEFFTAPNAFPVPAGREERCERNNLKRYSTAAALVAIFQEQERLAEPMESEKAAILLNTLSFGIKKGSNDQSLVMNAYDHMLASFRDRMLKEGRLPISWLKQMMEAVSFSLDTTESMVVILRYAITAERLDSRTVEELFSVFADYASGLAEKVRPVFDEMASTQLQKGLALDDPSIINWICKMAILGDKYFSNRLNTSDWLIAIFNASGKDNHSWLSAFDVKSCFAAMQKNAAELKNKVRIAYTQMLDRYEASAEENKGSVFQWLCEMTGTDVTPYAYDDNWLTAQHEKMLKLLSADDYQNQEKLRIIASWFKEKTIGNGTKTVQQFCNDALNVGKSEPAQMFRNCFESVDLQFDKLCSFYGKKIEEEFKLGLVSLAPAEYGAYLKHYDEQLGKISRKLNDIYAVSKNEVEDFMERSFKKTSDMNVLSEIGKGIPESQFKKAWQEKLNGTLRDEQTKLFNGCRSPEELQELRNILEQNGGLIDCLKAAYELIDQYDAWLEKLINQDETEILECAGKTVNNEVLRRLERAKDVNETLCKCIRNQKHPAMNELKAISFRHAVSAWLMSVALISSIGKDNYLHIRWENVIKEALIYGNSSIQDTIKAEGLEKVLKNASKNPYAAKNQFVLRQLLALVDAISYANPSWEKEITQFLYTNSACVQYQHALARKPKQGALYGLHFTNDNMLDFSKTQQS